MRRNISSSTKLSKIAYWRKQRAHSVSQDRYEGYKEALQSGFLWWKLVHFSFGFMLEDNSYQFDGESSSNRTRCHHDNRYSRCWRGASIPIRTPADDYFLIRLVQWLDIEAYIDINAVELWRESVRHSYKLSSDHKEGNCLLTSIDWPYHYETLGVFRSTFTAYLDDQDLIRIQKEEHILPFIWNEPRSSCLNPVKTSSAATGPGDHF